MKTLKNGVGIGAFCTSMLIVLVLASEGWTVPYFSRKYRTSCVTCHEAFPKRNAVGEGFRMRGFQFVDDDVYRKEEPVEMGDGPTNACGPRRSGRRPSRPRSPCR